jgi:hypothetical protein
VPAPDPYRGAPGGRAAPREAPRPVHDRYLAGWDGIRVGTGRRYGVFEMLAHDWQVGWRGAWPVAASASSSWGGLWSAARATGKPTVYPLSGDLPGTWAPAHPRGGVEWLEVDFGAPILARGLRVFETWHPGAVFALVADGDTALWADEPARGSGARVLEVALEAPRAIQRVRAYLDNDLAPGWIEIDAIGLLRAE